MLVGDREERLVNGMGEMIGLIIKFLIPLIKNNCLTQINLYSNYITLVG
jgi:hypothetical protein